MLQKPTTLPLYSVKLSSLTGLPDQGQTLVDAVFEAELAGQCLGLLRQLLGLGDRFLDAADHVEGAFGQVVVLAVRPPP